ARVVDARRSGGGVAAVGGLVAVIAIHGASAGALADETAVAAGAVAEAAAAFGAGGAALAVTLARVERPETAHVDRRLILPRPEERGMARVGAGRRREIDRGDPELLHAVLRAHEDVAVG